MYKSRPKIWWDGYNRYDQDEGNSSKEGLERDVGSVTCDSSSDGAKCRRGMRESKFCAAGIVVRDTELLMKKSLMQGVSYSVLLLYSYNYVGEYVQIF